MFSSSIYDGVELVTHFEGNVLNFTQRSLATLRNKGHTPEQAVKTILLVREVDRNLGDITWFIAQHIVILAIIRRHNLTGGTLKFLEYADGYKGDPEDECPF